MSLFTLKFFCAIRRRGPHHVVCLRAPTILDPPLRRLEIKLLMLDQKVCDNSEHLLNIPPRSSGPAADNGSTVVPKVLSNITVSELAEKLNLKIHTPKIAPQGDSETCNSSNKQQSATSLISKENPDDNNVNHNSNDNQQKQPSVIGLPSKDDPHGDIMNHNSDDKKQKQPPALMPSPITSPNKHAKRDAAQPTYSRTLSHGLKSTESGFCMFSGVDSSRVYGTAVAVHVHANIIKCYLCLFVCI